MPQLNREATNHEYVNSGAHLPEVSVEPNSPSVQLNSVMTELNRLSKSFVDSYQNLEGQVEHLNGKLQSETKEKNSAMLEKQKLLGEKAFLSDRLQSLLAIMPAGVVVIDGDGKVKDCNAKAIDILGRPLLGELWISVINRVFQPQADDGHQVSLKDGRKIHIETRALDVEPGQLVVLTDLTKSRQLQAEQTQQQKLTSMGKMIASLAHQIRTPLSAAILYGSNITKDNIDNDLKKNFSNKLLERLHFMERQIDDMLGFVRGERKQKNFVEPSKLFKAIVSMKQELPDFVSFKSKGVNILERQVLIDQDAILGAVTNLIRNACDACSKAEKPNVNVVFTLGSNLNIIVSDNGEGISKELQKKIFEPFHTTKKSGNGLGLAIVHGIVAEHKGRIKVNSNQEEGATFEITLPLVSTIDANNQTDSKSRANKTAINLMQENSYEF
jgi:two-component system, sensor histidine kinase FlrB